MAQGVEVGTSIGYAVKRVAWALRAEMEHALQDLGLTVSQYASLEQLAHSPGLTNAELARAVFVTRQATHQLLTGLRAAGLVAVTGTGREQRVTLTDEGAQRLVGASAAVAAVERRMLAGLDDADQDALRAGLAACLRALDADG